VEGLRGGASEWTFDWAGKPSVATIDICVHASRWGWRCECSSPGSAVPAQQSRLSRPGPAVPAREAWFRRTWLRQTLWVCPLAR
jgi:hypothetical protein